MTKTDIARFTLRPGMFLLVTTGRARGGVTLVHTNVKEERKGHAEKKTYQGIRHTDHAELCAEADKLASKGRALVRKHACKTELGWVAHWDQVTALAAELKDLKRDVRDFNHRAQLGGSARRVSVGAVPLKIEIDNAAAALEIAESIQDTLAELLAFVRRGDVQKARTFIATRAKNLPNLAMGMQKFALQDALACAKAALSEIGKAAKEEREPDVDTGAIESAIGLFGSWDDDDQDEDSASVAV